MTQSAPSKQVVGTHPLCAYYHLLWSKWAKIKWPFEEPFSSSIFFFLLLSLFFPPFVKTLFVSRVPFGSRQMAKATHARMHSRTYKSATISTGKCSLKMLFTNDPIQPLPSTMGSERHSFREKNTGFSDSQKSHFIYLYLFLSALSSPIYLQPNCNQY